MSKRQEYTCESCGTMVDVPDTLVRAVAKAGAQWSDCCSCGATHELYLDGDDQICAELFGR